MRNYEYQIDEITLQNKFNYKYLKDFVNAANMPDMPLMLMSHAFPFPYTEDDAVSFIEKNRENGSEIFSVDFYIFYNKQFAGVIGISDIDYLNLRAHVGYWVSMEYWNHGIATRSLKKIIQFAGDELKLHSLYTATRTDNVRSAKVLLANHFSIYGVEPDSFNFNGKFYSSLLFSLLL
ncbi:MAG: GNAT family N-acetyltransferase [Ferroplasma sp.]